MDKWLAQIGLEGRALQSAARSCEDNFVDSLDHLRILADDEKRFNTCFPQAMLQTVILKALADEKHKKVEATASEPTQAEAKDRQKTDNRYSSPFMQ